MIEINILDLKNNILELNSLIEEYDSLVEMTVQKFNGGV